jgi:hypothetical protein
MHTPIPLNEFREPTTVSEAGFGLSRLVSRNRRRPRIVGGTSGCQQFESVEIFALGGRIVMRVGKLKS